MKSKRLKSRHATNRQRTGCSYEANYTVLTASEGDSLSLTMPRTLQ